MQRSTSCSHCHDNRVTKPLGSLTANQFVTVFKLGCTEFIFVDPRVNVVGEYHWDILLSWQMLPLVHQTAGNLFVFWQDSLPAHRACAIIKYLRQIIPEFISSDFWPPNSLDLNPVDYKVWGHLQDRVYHKHVCDVIWNSIWLRCGHTSIRPSLMRPSLSGGSDF